jgi:hypothetical protein
VDYLVTVVLINVGRLFVFIATFIILCTVTLKSTFTQTLYFEPIAIITATIGNGDGWYPGEDLTSPQIATIMYFRKDGMFEWHCKAN